LRRYGDGGLGVQASYGFKPPRPASDPLILPDSGKWPRYRPNPWRGSELESERRESLPRAARAKAEWL
jgi:hypothetical protein